MKKLALLIIVLSFVMTVNAVPPKTYVLEAISDSYVSDLNPDTAYPTGDISSHTYGPAWTANPSYPMASYVSLSTDCEKAYVQFQMPGDETGSDYTDVTSVSLGIYQTTTPALSLTQRTFLINDGLDTADCETYTWNNAPGNTAVGLACYPFVEDYYADTTEAVYMGQVATRNEGDGDTFVDDIVLLAGTDSPILDDTDGLFTVMFSQWQYYLYVKTFASTETAAGEAHAPTLTLELIPEPATMALLGLGGLFLSRRKK